MDDVTGEDPWWEALKKERGGKKYILLPSHLNWKLKISELLPSSHLMSGTCRGQAKWHRAANQLPEERSRDTQGGARLLQLEKPCPKLEATSFICEGPGGKHFKVRATRLPLAQTQLCHRGAAAAANNRYKSEHDWTIKFYLWTHKLEFPIIFTYHKSFKCSNHLKL